MFSKVRSTFWGFVVITLVAGLGYVAIHLVPVSSNGQVTDKKSRSVQLVIEFDPYARYLEVEISHGINQVGSPLVATKLSPWKLTVIAQPGDAVELGAYQRENGTLTCKILLNKKLLHSRTQVGNGGVNCHTIVP